MATMDRKATRFQKQYRGEDTLVPRKPTLLHQKKGVISVDQAEVTIVNFTHSALPELEQLKADQKELQKTVRWCRIL